MQLFGSTSTPHFADVTGDFLSPTFWVTILVVALGGAFGGISYELMLRKGSIELPHGVQADAATAKTCPHSPAEPTIALGIVGRALVGSAASVSALMVFTPSSGQATLALSVICGAAAPAVIRVLRKRVLAALSGAERSNHTEHNRQAVAPSGIDAKAPAAQPA